MAHLWTIDQMGQWAVLPLDHEAYLFGVDRMQPIRRRSDPVAPEAMVMWRAEAATGETWLLKSGTPQAVMVNAEPLYLGLRVLRDKDEIRVNGSARFFFSTERLASVLPFPVIGRAVFCARCKQEIGAGIPAVKCPQCGTWCHQSNDLGCWTYAPTCPLCDQGTALDVGYRWTPEGL